MEPYSVQTPVILIAFNRPDTTRQVLAALSQVQLSHLLVILDGPRSKHPKDQQKCTEVRRLIEKMDWKCEISTNYAENNMGLRARVSSGLNWAFEQVERAIILEDDCVADPTFFRFCDELLDKYEEDQRIFMISGNNYQFGRRQSPYSYYFSIHAHIWGWATWRRAWKYYDDRMTLWPHVRKNHLLRAYFKEPRALRYWENRFQQTYDEKINSWAYRWTLSCWLQNSLTVLPEKNLVTNIGFGLTATNTQGRPSRYTHVSSEALDFPIKHPPYVIRDSAADEYSQEKLFRNHPLAPIKRVTKQFLGRLFRRL